MEEDFSKKKSIKKKPKEGRASAVREEGSRLRSPVSRSKRSTPILSSIGSGKPLSGHSRWDG
jgi:hypothetical protein